MKRLISGTVLLIVPSIGTILSSCNTQNNHKIREEYFTDKTGDPASVKYSGNF